LRLGKYPCDLREGTAIRALYGKNSISERHRHRYEFNNDFREKLSEAGMCLSGFSPDGRLVETVEIPGEEFFIGVQFHPEFKSRPNRPHPLFYGFVRASLDNSRSK
ncbi:MAG: gamma-glutamyl-gamma-aminobutyrate hydrolase family protein, partial [Spirochaetales bacterium]|nr:gamma-glutamyl-gamma-aminobutyrate hydrolase family protein [Spirochaetales bacterium]